MKKRSKKWKCFAVKYDEPLGFEIKGVVNDEEICLNCSQDDLIFLEEENLMTINCSNQTYILGKPHEDISDLFKDYFKN